MLGAISSLASGLVSGDWWNDDKSKATTAGLLNSGGDLLGMGVSKLLGFGFGGSASDKANAQIESMGKLQENALLNDLRSCKNPFNCPHGRPTVIYYSNYDLEKLFKRSGFEKIN